MFYLRKTISIIGKLTNKQILKHDPSAHYIRKIKFKNIYVIIWFQYNFRLISKILLLLKGSFEKKILNFFFKSSILFKIEIEKHVSKIFPFSQK